MKCFQYGALKDKHIFRFEADGGDVAGSYFIERDYDAEQTETYDFSGTRTGNSLKIKFAKDAKLQGQPYEINNAVLTAVKAGDAESLQVKFYGTAKTAVYSIDLESCEPSYATLTKNAKRILFAKSKTSATLPVSFKNTDERKMFLLNAAKGQELEIKAEGCSITVYLPNKKIYQILEYEDGDEKTYTETTIDFLTLEKLPRTGDYLVVLQKMMENAQPASATFKVTN